MKTIKRSDISPIKMSTKPLEVIINSDMKVINTDGFIYEYVGIGWIKLTEAKMKDYKDIPELTD